jgi:hypothetical protein
MRMQNEVSDNLILLNAAYIPRNIAAVKSQDLFHRFVQYDIVGTVIDILIQVTTRSLFRF